MHACHVPLRHTFWFTLLVLFQSAITEITCWSGNFKQQSNKTWTNQTQVNNIFEQGISGSYAMVLPAELNKRIKIHGTRVKVKRLRPQLYILICIFPLAILYINGMLLVYYLPPNGIIYFKSNHCNKSKSIYL